MAHSIVKSLSLSLSLALSPSLAYLQSLDNFRVTLLSPWRWSSYMARHRAFVTTEIGTQTVCSDMSRNSNVLAR